MTLAKVLTVKHPWAGFIAQRVKLLETRTWITLYRGPLYIHVSRSMDKAALAKFGLPVGYASEAELRAEMGHVICRAELYMARPMTPADECLALCACEAGRAVWGFRGVQLVRPIALRGQLGIFDAELPDFESIVRRLGS